MQFIYFQAIDFLILFRFGQAIPQLLQGSLLNLHIVVIFKLPVIIFTNPFFNRWLDSDGVAGTPEIVEGKAENECSQQENDDLGQSDGYGAVSYTHLTLPTI